MKALSELKLLKSRLLGISPSSSLVRNLQSWLFSLMPQLIFLSQNRSYLRQCFHHLDVYTSPVGDVDAVAAFLDKPSLRLQKPSYGWFCRHPFSAATIQFHEEENEKSSLG